MHPPWPLQGWQLDTAAFDLVEAGRCTIATDLRGLGLEVTTPTA